MNKKQMFGILVMFVLCLSSVAVTLSRANASGNQVPAPSVSTSNSPRPSTGDLINLAINVGQGNSCSSTWSAHRSNMTNPGNGSHFLSEGFQGEISTTLAGSQSDLEFNLGSTTNLMDVPGMFIDTPYVNFSINFCNAENFSVSVGKIIYIGDLPTVTNNVTFNNIALSSPSQGSVTLVIYQTVVCNWTNMTVRIGAYADLSKMKLCLSNGTEIPQNTDFSLNLIYQFDMSNSTASQLEGHAVNYQPSNITSTSVFFSGNGTSGKQISLANMNLADNYTEIQSPGQSEEKVARAYFASAGIPSWAVNCCQSFPNLTYGKTLAVQSDPTITVQHKAI